MRKLTLDNLKAFAGSGSAAFAVFAAVLFVVVATMLTFAPTQIAAKPQYAAATGRPCTACHTTPPALNACGQKYKTDKSTKC